MPVPDPQRRETRRTHLDASVVPVERAHLALAKVLEDGNRLLDETDTAHAVSLLMANDHRAMAEELHWWLPPSRSRLL